MLSTRANAELNLGVTITRFLQRYWQKRPKLMRNALHGFVCPISANDLAGLACTEGSLARIVRGKSKTYTVASGPFSEASFANLGTSNWTLLVQEVDQWDRNVREVLKYFDFLPRWRIEDVMVSYAVKGGSVGAHVDQYDVFLLQARGQRRWQIDDRIQAKSVARQQFLTKAKLKLLANFEPNRDWVLNPGDMLYLPPGVPHHGVALDDDCMTFSIGLRAPSATEMLENFARTHAQTLPDSLRYSDPELSGQAHSVTLDGASITRVRETLTQAVQLSDTDLGAWFADFMSAYRAPRLTLSDRAAKAAGAESTGNAAVNSTTGPGSAELKAVAKLGVQLANGVSLTLAPGMRVIEWQGALHIGGQKLVCERQLREVLSAFSVRVTSEIWQRFSANSRLLVLNLKRANALIVERRAQHDL